MVTKKIQAHSTVINSWAEDPDGFSRNNSYYNVYLVCDLTTLMYITLYVIGTGNNPTILVHSKPYHLTMEFLTRPTPISHTHNRMLLKDPRPRKSSLKLNVIVRSLWSGHLCP